LAASPIFLLYLMVAMTDVPVAAWWLAAVVLALKPQPRWRLLMSGVMTAVALLTRPNLVALAAPVAVLVGRGAGHRRELVSRLIAWGIPAALGAIAVAIANAVLYGSPLRSGYGDLQTLYSPRYTWTNLTLFTTWLVRTQTPFILLGIAAVSWHARWCLAFAACVLASYLWYVPFDDWTFLRFLLPALPMLLATAAAALMAFARRVNLPGGSVVAAGLLLVCVGAWEGRTAFSLARDEARYVAAAGEVRKLPPTAVVISNAHSGSVRYYANRITLRYEWLGADEYNEAVRTLRTRGHTLYALFDDYEVGEFRRRYAGVTDVSWLDRPPLGVINGRVFLYTVP